MPEKKHQETPEEQSERFRKEAQRLIDAGELNPIEADDGVESVLKNSDVRHRRPVDRKIDG